MFKPFWAAAVLAAGSLAAAVFPAAAQDYPKSPIKWVVPFPAGGSTDVFARVLSEALLNELGQPLVIENRGGAGGAIGTANAAGAAADGHTLASGTVSTHAINVSLYPELAYDPVKDFAPVTLLGYVPNVLVVNADSPYRSVKDLIEAGRHKTLTFASNGNGTSQHLTGELFRKQSGIQMSHIPYRGSPQALQDLMGGRVDFMFDQTFSLIRSGKVRALAVSADERSPLLPDVPTLQEAGLEGFKVLSWHAVFVPAGTPQPVIDRLNGAFNAALSRAEVRDKLQAQGLQVMGGPAQALDTLMRSEIERWAVVVKESGARMD
ncbi:tripartite tricarboxylate transporter substrate binding protein [Orrella sp. JC864]|uniref:Bug family tripartite tricarboxylate transporter substrate binding protein n=1 Tax=Orrella sp. JC864 TaxID=3120298 RepID=UPI00300B8C57